MAFESLSERIQDSIKKLKGQDRLTEENMDEVLREIRLALLEADVNYEVVKEFISNVKEKALGQEVLSSLTPDQMVIKIVHDELVTILGTDVATVDYSKDPTIIMMVGLQGAGKTTTTGKIANMVKTKEGKNPLLVAGDIYRPAAIDQLKTLGDTIGVPVFSLGTEIAVAEIVRQALDYAKENHHDVIFIDTAGRLHIDEVLMDELVQVKSIAHPDEILLVVDALTGQDIVNVAQTFNEKLGLTGAVITKLDGDARGGGALSIRHITNVPIKYIGTGEKLEAVDLFYPDRMADRILGMGDVMSLIEKAQDVIDEESAQKSMNRLTSGQFGMDDLLEQMKQVQKLGSMSSILKMIPGIDKKAISQINDADTEKEYVKIESIINSMTKEERRDPSIITAKRKIRIANGSGRQVSDVNSLLKRFEQSKKMMENMTRINPLTGQVSQKPKKKNAPNPNRKKERHKKKKKR